MTDTDALQRYARRRDPEAFAHLVESYQQMVYAVCLRRLGHEADARDATQDTFVKLAKSAGDIRAAGGSVVGWLHRCATTTSIDLIRRESRRRGRERAVAVMEQMPSADPPWEDVRSALDEALGELPEAQRDLIVQRFLVGHTQARLAAEAEVSPSMMSRRVHAALDALRDRLRDKGFGVGLAALTSGLGVEAAVAVPVSLTASLTATAATTATATSSALPMPGSGLLSCGGGAPTSGGGGWLWLGTKIKLSTAILGSLGVHAALVGAVLWLGPGLSTLVTPSTPSVVPQPAGSGPSLPASPSTVPPPRPADSPHVIRVADADASADEVPAGFVYIMGSITGPGAWALPADAEFTLKQLIDAAGGSDAIDESIVRLIRRTEGEPPEQTVVEAPLRDVINTPIGDIQMQPNDLIVVGDAAAGVKSVIEESWTPVPSILDPALTGEWLVQIEDRQGNSVIGDTQPWAENAKMIFRGSDIVFELQSGALIRIEISREQDEAGQTKWFQTIRQAPAELVAFSSQMNNQRPLQFTGHRIEGDRVYAPVQSQNPETGQLETIPAGGFDHTGHRQFLVRPEIDPARVELEVTGPVEGWQTVTIFDIDEQEPGQPVFLDFESGQLLPLQAELRNSAMGWDVLNFVEREKIDLVVEIAINNNRAVLVSPVGDDLEQFVETVVGELPFSATVRSRENQEVEIVVEQIDDQAKSLTLQYRIVKSAENAAAAVAVSPPVLNPQDTVKALLAAVVADEDISKYIPPLPEAQQQVLDMRDVLKMRGNRDLLTLRVPNVMIHKLRRAVVVSDPTVLRDTRSNRSGVYVFFLQRFDDTGAGQSRWLLDEIGFEPSFSVDHMKEALGIQ